MSCAWSFRGRCGLICVDTRSSVLTATGSWSRPRKSPCVRCAADLRSRVPSRVMMWQGRPPLSVRGKCVKPEGKQGRCRETGPQGSVIQGVYFSRVLWCKVANGQTFSGVHTYGFALGWRRCTCIYLRVGDGVYTVYIMHGLAPFWSLRSLFQTAVCKKYRLGKLKNGVPIEDWGSPVVSSEVGAAPQAM